MKEWTDASMDQYLHKIPLKAYAKEILEYYKSQGILLALATANDRALYEPCLKRLGIYDYFDMILDVNAVKEGKSSPKIFRSISDAFKVLPEETLLFEDTLMGLKTSYHAGYISIAVFDEESRKLDEEKRKYSYVFIHSFQELLNI